MDKRDLTKRQRELIDELEQIIKWCGLDYSDIDEYESKLRTIIIQIIKERYIKSQVIMDYTLIDEFLNSEISWYQFGKKRGFNQLWRTKKFQRFQYYVIERLSLLQKLQYVKSFIKIPKKIVADIERLNNLRNGLAHSFFPENLRTSKPIWKGKKIFSFDGFSSYLDDIQKMKDFFAERI